MVITAQDTKIKPGYKQTEVGVIPEDWEVKKLGEIGECIIGLTYRPSNVTSDGLLVLRSSNVADSGLVFIDNVFVNIEVPDKLIVRNGDILICVRNGSRNLIGKCALIDDRAEGMTFGAFMSIFRTKYAHFVFHQFQSKQIKRQIGENIGATINQITNKNLNSFQIPFPKEEKEQTAIATALSDVDALITSLDKLIAKKRDIKQAAMQQLLTGKRRLPGFSKELKPAYKQTEVRVIPEDWDVKKLGDVVEFLDGRRRPISERDRAKMHGEYPYYGASGVVDYVNDYIFDEELILLGEDGENILSRSCRLAFLVSGKIWVNNHAHVLRPRASTDARFLTEYLESLDYEQYNTGTAQPKLNKRVCLEIIVPLPTLPEQCAIAAVLSDMDAEIAALEQKRDKTRALKQGMMQELLTGKTRLVAP